ncbi:MAG TPA: cupin domain-containing protein [Longimicrobiaceae bacterium]|nr:cupin domain-containing protein [Longimicrobiaceae bacterium]
MHARASALIRELELQPHPEGGYYREVFRSPVAVSPQGGRGARSALTAIYFLLTEGGCSRWHRVASDEAWCWLEGDPLDLLTIDASGAGTSLVLGPLGDGQVPLGVVAAGEWQAARSRGDYTLVSCLVAPGFDFADFSLLADHPAAAEEVGRRHPQLAPLI